MSAACCKNASKSSLSKMQQRLRTHILTRKADPNTQATRPPFIKLTPFHLTPKPSGMRTTYVRCPEKGILATPSVNNRSSSAVMGTQAAIKMAVLALQHQAVSTQPQRQQTSREGVPLIRHANGTSDGKTRPCAARLAAHDLMTS